MWIKNKGKVSNFPYSYYLEDGIVDNLLFGIIACTLTNFLTQDFLNQTHKVAYLQQSSDNPAIKTNAILFIKGE